ALIPVACARAPTSTLLSRFRPLHPPTPTLFPYTTLFRSPTEFVIGPPAAQSDPQGQKQPRRRGPGARPTCPRRIQLPGKERRNRKRKDDREPHITHVQQRRMKYQTHILQKGIQIHSFHGCRNK